MTHVNTYLNFQGQAEEAFNFYKDIFGGELRLFRFGDMPMDVLLGKPPKMQRDVHHVQNDYPAIDLTGISLEEAAKRVLLLPTVGDKSFLITIGDRTVGGMSVRDQMVGPWQVPVADCAVTAMSYEGYLGEAMAMGERPRLRASPRHHSP